MIVLHESRAELADAAATRCRSRAAADRGRHRPRRRRRRSSRDDHGAEVIERRDNPGFGAASNVGARARHRGRDGPAEPRHRRPRRRAGELARRAHETRRRAARAAAAQRRRQRPAQRPPAPRDARRLPPRAGPPAAAPAAAPGARRALPGELAAHRRLGDRRLPGGATTDTLKTTRPVRPAHPPLRRGHGPVPAGARRRHPDDPAPGPRGSPTPAATASCARASRSSCSPGSASDGDRGHARPPSARPRRRRPGAHLRHPRARQAPQHSASAPSSPR